MIVTGFYTEDEPEFFFLLVPSRSVMRGKIKKNIWDRSTCLICHCSAFGRSTCCIQGRLPYRYQNFPASRHLIMKYLSVACMLRKYNNSIIKTPAKTPVGGVSEKQKDTGQGCLRVSMDDDMDIWTWTYLFHTINKNDVPCKWKYTYNGK